LALGMTYYRKGDYASAIAEGKKAERMKPHDQLVHTNLSLFFMKAGDKTTAEHHGLQARISSWREESKAPDAKPADNPELQMAKPKLEPVKFQAMPWKKKPDAKHQIMKTAFELAMERLNKTSTTIKLTQTQKAEIAELESKYKAKIAERELLVERERAKAIDRGEMEAFEQLEKQLISDRKSLSNELEEKKEKVRQKSD